MKQTCWTIDHLKPMQETISKRNQAKREQAEMILEVMRVQDIVNEWAQGDSPIDILHVRDLVLAYDVLDEVTHQCDMEAWDQVRTIKTPQFSDLFGELCDELLPGTLLIDISEEGEMFNLVDVHKFIRHRLYKFDAWLFQYRLIELMPTRRQHTYFWELYMNALRQQITYWLKWVQDPRWQSPNMIDEIDQWLKSLLLCTTLDRLVVHILGCDGIFYDGKLVDKAVHVGCWLADKDSIR